jgi:dihydropyrimidinase
MGKDDFSKIPNGHPAIEHRMELLFSEGVAKGRIDLSRFVEVNSVNAAKIFGMYPRKGSLSVGADADVVLFDPTEKHIISAKTHHMNVDYSAYEGVEVTGKVKTVLLRGKVVVHQNQDLTQKGYGKYIARKPDPVFLAH